MCPFSKLAASPLRLLGAMNKGHPGCKAKQETQMRCISIQALALMLEEGGGGVQKDLVAALKWHLAAAEQGNALYLGHSWTKTVSNTRILREPMSSLGSCGDSSQRAE